MFLIYFNIYLSKLSIYSDWFFVGQIVKYSKLKIKIQICFLGYQICTLDNQICHFLSIKFAQTLINTDFLGDQI